MENTHISQERQLHTGLTPFAGPWTREEAKHLVRRLMFGAKKVDVAHFEAMTMDDAVDELLNSAFTPPAPPVNDYNYGDDAGVIFDNDVPSGQPWLGSAITPNVEFMRIQSARTHWIREMINQPRNIREKMTLFWYNHLVFGFLQVFSGTMNYNYIVRLRSMALGNFKDMVRQTALEPAMLEYLNGTRNTAAAPDENYAREIQELFVIGKDLPNRFTEDDVRAAARLLTGWRINWQTHSSFFDSATHDTGNKQFSSFYNNTLIQGQSGPLAGINELNAFLDMLFAHNEAALFVCRKIYRFFVYHDIDAQTEQNVIVPLANIFRTNNYEVLPVLSALFKSEHFYDQANRSAMIKSPIDLWIGHIRMTGLQLPPASSLLDRFQATQMIGWLLDGMQQNPGDPPNVAGWPAYYQTPAFDKLWINNATIMKRNELLAWWTWNGYMTRNGVEIGFNVMSYHTTLEHPEDPNLFIDELTELYYGLPVTNAVKQGFIAVLLSGQTNTAYWTGAWNAYVAAPNDPTARGIVENRLKAFYLYLWGKEELHLM